LLFLTAKSAVEEPTAFILPKAFSRTNNEWILLFAVELVNKLLVLAVSGILED